MEKLIRIWLVLQTLHASKKKSFLQVAQKTITQRREENRISLTAVKFQLQYRLSKI